MSAFAPTCSLDTGNPFLPDFRVFPGSSDTLAATCEHAGAFFFTLPSRIHAFGRRLTLSRLGPAAQGSLPLGLPDFGRLSLAGILPPRFNGLWAHRLFLTLHAFGTLGADLGIGPIAVVGIRRFDGSTGIDVGIFGIVASGFNKILQVLSTTPILQKIVQNQ